MVRPDLLAPLALLDLLEREESKASLDLLDSRACLDPQVPLVRLANLETRVFPEKVVLLVLLVREVNVVSLVREVVLDLRVFRDLVDFLGHPEVMDPRVLLDLLEPQDLRDPQVCRACPEREVREAFLDPKETEETTARRDLRELLERMVQEV